MIKNPLDNMCGQEIKEMIENEIVSLQELDNPALEKLLAFETEMLCHGNGDMDIIRRCSALLDERSRSNKFDHVEISNIINKTKSEHITISDTVNSHDIDAPQRNKRFVLKRIAIIAAAILILITTTITIVAAFDIDISGLIKSIVGKPDGTTVNIDEFTFYNTDGSKKYDSVQKMIEEENLDIMYPTLLPEGTNLETLSLIAVQNNRDAILFATNDANVNIEIQLNTSEIHNSSDTIYEHNGIEYYVFSRDHYLAICYYNGDTYYIAANTYEDLILIIDNMKE